MITTGISSHVPYLLEEKGVRLKTRALSKFVVVVMFFVYIINK